MAHRDLLFSIEKEVEMHHEDFIHVRSLIIDQQVSNYPIFIFQKPSVSILGKKLRDESQSPDKWNIYITHLEELYLKKIILEDKLPDFQFQYKNNSDKFCILMIDDDDYSFIFVPMTY
jgi:hypothetical protein